MANSSSNNGSPELFFGTLAPTTTDHEDNASYIVTSDGTPTGTPLEFWKFDAETLTWVLIPSGGTTCPAPMTRAQLIALRNSGQLSKECHYVITNPSADGNLDVQQILLHAVNETTLSQSAKILTSHDTTAWDGVYDIDQDDVLEVTDNLENKVISNASILNFPFGVTTVNGNTVMNRANVIYNGGNFVNNVVYTDATVTTNGNTNRNHFESNSNTTVNSGDFRDNKVLSDSTVTSSTTGDIDKNTFGNNSNSIFSGSSNFDNNSVNTDANINITGGAVLNSKFEQLSNYIMSGGVLRESTIGQDADVTIISGDNYENVFGNSTVYRQVGTGTIIYSTIEGTTTWINGNTNISNVDSYVSTVNTTGSSGNLSNSTFNRAFVYAQNVPTITIVDSEVSSYGTLSVNNALRIYLNKTTVKDGSRVLASAGTRIDFNYSNLDSYSYVQSTVSGGVLYVNYTNISSLAYTRNLTPNTHRVGRCDISSQSNVRFEGTSSGCRCYYTNVSGGGAIYFNGSSTNCYSYYNNVSSLGQMYFTNSVNARFYYSNCDSYSYIRSIGASATHYAYYCNASARGYIQFLNSTGRLYAITAQAQSIVEKRGNGGNIYYSSFSAYFYAYLTRTTGTSSALFGQGRRTQTVTNPVNIAPYAIGGAWLNF